MATNVEFRTLAQLMEIGRSTACEIVNSVCEAITCHLLSRYLSIPIDEVQVQEIMEEFEGKTGFPQVIGAIDGCHIPIICPKDDPGHQGRRCSASRDLDQGEQCPGWTKRDRHHSDQRKVNTRG